MLSNPPIAGGPRERESQLPLGPLQNKLQWETITTTGTRRCRFEQEYAHKAQAKQHKLHETDGNDTTTNNPATRDKKKKQQNTINKNNNNNKNKIDQRQTVQPCWTQHFVWVIIFTYDLYCYLDQMKCQV